MTDYYSALRKAVDGLDPQSADARHSLYNDARDILVRRLDAVDPPLEVSEISQEKQRLEEAIRRVEGEFGSSQNEPGDGLGAVAPLAPDTTSGTPLPPPPSGSPPPARSPQRQDFEEAQAPKPEQSAPRSRLLTIPRLALIVGAIAVVVAAVAWSQRTIIADLLEGSDDGQTEVAVPEDVTPADSMSESEDRPADRPGVAGDSAIPGPPETSGELAAEAIAPPAATRDGSSTNGPSAVFLEQSTDRAAGVTTVGAAIDWQLVGDGTDQAEIRAELQIPDREMAVRLVIRRNTDPTLPATHVIETAIETRASFPGEGIRSMPGIILKAGVEDYGESLVGATTKVADGLFWMALSAAEADVESNLQLLRTGSWIDVRLVYEDGRRAILSFEKGPQGAEAFEKAFAAWDATGSGESNAGSASAPPGAGAAASADEGENSGAGAPLAVPLPTPPPRPSP